MKIYLHIVNNHPFCCAVGKDSEETEDVASFVSQAERTTGSKFSQRADRCEDNTDFYSADGRSHINILTIPSDTIDKNR